MIDGSRLGRKKTVKEKKGIESGRREKKVREITFAGRKREELPYIFNLLV
jgi:hypothetical protein